MKLYHICRERKRKEEILFFWILSSNFLGPSHRQLVYTICRFFRNFRSFVSRVSTFFFLSVCFFCFSFTFSFVLLYTEELSLSNFLHGRNLCANERSRPSPRCRRALSQISAARSQYCSNKEDTFWEQHRSLEKGYFHYIVYFQFQLSLTKLNTTLRIRK